ncbi:MAG: hypothetical protein ACK419_05565 [Pyrinomonadaceae bacterium]
MYFSEAIGNQKRCSACEQIRIGIFGWCDYCFWSGFLTNKCADSLITVAINLKEN